MKILLTLTSLLIITSSYASAESTIIHEETKQTIHQPLSRDIACTTYGEKPNQRSIVTLLPSEYPLRAQSIMALATTRLTTEAQNDDGALCEVVQKLNIESRRNFGFINTITTRKLVLKTNPNEDYKQLIEVIEVTISNLGGENVVTLSGEGTVMLSNNK